MWFAFKTAPQNTTWYDIHLPPPHTPAVLEPVAQALRPLAG